MSGQLLRQAEELKAKGDSVPRPGRDPVNRPMVNSWVEALGDANPIYVDADAARAAGHGGPVAPPAMIQVWTMQGLHGQRSSDDPLGEMTRILDEAGYTSVVATNCEQTYHRYLHPGEQLSVTSRLEDLVGPKQTALGEGWFFTTVSTWYAGEEPVAEMLFRILKFRPKGAPAAAEPAGTVLRPVISHDTAFFWEGTAAGELRVQHCPQCGNLRHPPGPMCPTCGNENPGHIVASGRGTVFSFVVHHHPKGPGKDLPFAVALVELEEGVRMLGQMVDVDPAQVHIGMPVEVALTRIDDDLTLPYWRPAGTAR
jgi:uncharacterized OB-fold protein